MSRGLFEGHIQVAPGVQDDPVIVEYYKDRAVDFVAGRGGTNLGEMIFSLKECDCKTTQVDFAVYADFPE